MVLRSPARNEPRSGLLQMSGWRVFQTLAVRGKKECLRVFMFDLGMSIYVSELVGGSA